MESSKWFNLKSIAFIGLCLFGSHGCSEIPAVDDPVIGIWARTEITTGKTLREEWIFNDVYLGRYHLYENQTLKIKSDFTWKVNQNIYTITYPGLKRASESVTIKRRADNELLETLGGETLASRE